MEGSVLKIFVAVFICFANNLSECSGSKDDNIRFLVIGDWGGLPFFPYRTAIEKAVASGLGKFAQSHDAEFILALGDNFYYDGVQSINDPRFQETYNHVFTSQYLDVDWYFVAGNHDHNGNVSAQIEFSKLVKRWMFPNFYYNLSFKTKSSPSTSVDIVMVDTVLLCGNSDADYLHLQPNGPVDIPDAEDQWDWLEKQLNDSKAEYLIVAGHYPVFSIAEHGPTKCLVDRLMPMLYKYQVSAYMCGHDHNLQHLRYKDDTYKHTVEYFLSGAANFIDPTVTHKDSVPKGSSMFHWADTLSFGGFGFTDVSRDNMTFTFIEANGKELYKWSLPPRKL